MKRKNGSEDLPVQGIRMPLCYGCGVALTHVGYCDRCLEQTQRDLQGIAQYNLPKNPANGDRGIYNGVNCLWVNGYWINATYAPPWARARADRRATGLTAEKRAELAQEHARMREKLPQMFGAKDETVPF